MLHDINVCDLATIKEVSRRLTNKPQRFRGIFNMEHVENRSKPGRPPNLKGTLLKFKDQSTQKRYKQAVMSRIANRSDGQPKF